MPNEIIWLNPIGYRHGEIGSYSGTRKGRIAWKALDFEYNELGNDHIKDDLANFLKISSSRPWEQILAEFRRRYGDARGIWLTRSKSYGKTYYGEFGETERLYYNKEDIIIDCGDEVYVINRHNPRGLHAGPLYPDVPQGITPRRLAAARRAIEKQRKAAGMFADQIIIETPEQRVDRLNAQALEWQKAMDVFRKKQFLEAKRMVESWPRKKQERFFKRFREVRYPPTSVYILTVGSHFKNPLRPEKWKYWVKDFTNYEPISSRRAHWGTLQAGFTITKDGLIDLTDNSQYQSHISLHPGYGGIYSWRTWKGEPTQLWLYPAAEVNLTPAMMNGLASLIGVHKITPDTPVYSNFHRNILFRLKDTDLYRRCYEKTH